LSALSVYLFYLFVLRCAFWRRCAAPKNKRETISVIVFFCRRFIVPKSAFSRKIARKFPRNGKKTPPKRRVASSVRRGAQRPAPAKNAESATLPFKKRRAFSLPRRLSAVKNAVKNAAKPRRDR